MAEGPEAQKQTLAPTPSQPSPPDMGQGLVGAIGTLSCSQILALLNISTTCTLGIIDF